jgi:Uma2 family endonuclease
MGTKTLVPVEEYLSTSYEPSREYVRGELVERGMPGDSHSKVQLEVGHRFRLLRDTHRMHARTELHLRLAPDLIRIADVAVYHPQPPGEEIPTHPPFIVLEILSPDDRYSDVTKKLEEYRNWGVRHVWLIDPSLRKLYTHSGRLQEVEAFEIDQPPLRLTPADLFD